MRQGSTQVGACARQHRGTPSRAHGHTANSRKYRTAAPIQTVFKKRNRRARQRESPRQSRQPLNFRLIELQRQSVSLSTSHSAHFNRAGRALHEAPILALRRASADLDGGPGSRRRLAALTGCVPCPRLFSRIKTCGPRTLLNKRQYGVDHRCLHSGKPAQFLYGLHECIDFH